MLSMYFLCVLKFLEDELEADKLMLDTEVVANQYICVYIYNIYSLPYCYNNHSFSPEM
jgi:hypothetical protein